MNNRNRIELSQKEWIIVNKLEKWTKKYKFWRIPKIVDWDGKYIGRQILWESHQEREVLCEFDDDTDLCETLKIGGKSIGEVLEKGET